MLKRGSWNLNFFKVYEYFQKEEIYFEKKNWSEINMYK